MTTNRKPDGNAFISLRLQDIPGNAEKVRLKKKRACIFVRLEFDKFATLCR